MCSEGDSFPFTSMKRSKHNMKERKKHTPTNTDSYRLCLYWPMRSGISETISIIGKASERAIPTEILNQRNNWMEIIHSIHSLHLGNSNQPHVEWGHLHSPNDLCQQPSEEWTWERNFLSENNFFFFGVSQIHWDILVWLWLGFSVGMFFGNLRGEIWKSLYFRLHYTLQHGMGILSVCGHFWVEELMWLPKMWEERDEK